MLRKIVFPALILFFLSPFTANCQSQKSGSNPTSGGSAMSLSLQTSAFKSGGEIPAQFTCSGADSSPALTWSGAPQGTQAFALIVDDPDAPSGTFIHWVIYDIPANATSLAERVAKSDQLPDGSRQGKNGFGRLGYGGPCPPPGKPHRYFFKLYALDSKLNLPAGASKTEVEQAMKGHILAQGELMGTYRR